MEPFDTIILFTASAFLFVASIIDLKTGEIPYKVSVGMIGCVFLLRLMDPNGLESIYSSLLIGVLYFAVGYLHYHFNQWGGGDVLILAGIGLAVGTGAFGILPMYLVYFLCLGIVIIPYALIYALFLTLRYKKVIREFMKDIKAYRTLLFVSGVLGFLILPVNAVFALIPFIFVLYMVFIIYLKATMKVALETKTTAGKLKEGDVLSYDVVVEGKAIIKKMHIDGLSKEDIATIKRLVDEGKIKNRFIVRNGIKFVPALFLAYILLVFAGGDIINAIII